MQRRREPGDRSEANEPAARPASGEVLIGSVPPEPPAGPQIIVVPRDESDAWLLSERSLVGPLADLTAASERSEEGSRSPGSDERNPFAGESTNTAYARRARELGAAVTRTSRPPPPPRQRTITRAGDEPAATPPAPVASGPARSSVVPYAAAWAALDRDPHGDELVEPAEEDLSGLAEHLDQGSPTADAAEHAVLLDWNDELVDTVMLLPPTAAALAARVREAVKPRSEVDGTAAAPAVSEPGLVGAGERRADDGFGAAPTDVVADVAAAERERGRAAGVWIASSAGTLVPPSELQPTAAEAHGEGAGAAAGGALKPLVADPTGVAPSSARDVGPEPGLVASLSGRALGATFRGYAGPDLAKMLGAAASGEAADARGDVSTGDAGQRAADVARGNAADVARGDEPGPSSQPTAAYAGRVFGPDADAELSPASGGRASQPEAAYVARAFGPEADGAASRGRAQPPEVKYEPSVIVEGVEGVQVRTRRRSLEHVHEPSVIVEGMGGAPGRERLQPSATHEPSVIVEGMNDGPSHAGRASGAGARVEGTQGGGSASLASAGAYGEVAQGGGRISRAARPQAGSWISPARAGGHTVAHGEGAQGSDRISQAGTGASARAYAEGPDGGGRISNAGAYASGTQGGRRISHARPGGPTGANTAGTHGAGRSSNAGAYADGTQGGRRISQAGAGAEGPDRSGRISHPGVGERAAGYGEGPDGSGRISHAGVGEGAAGYGEGTHGGGRISTAGVGERAGAYVDGAQEGGRISLAGAAGHGEGTHGGGTHGGGRILHAGAYADGTQGGRRMSHTGAGPHAGVNAEGTQGRGRVSQGGAGPYPGSLAEGTQGRRGDPYAARLAASAARASGGRPSGELTGAGAPDFEQELTEIESLQKQLALAVEQVRASEARSAEAQRVAQWAEQTAVEAKRISLQARASGGPSWLGFTTRGVV
ncbi:MAG: hypothetical protein ABW321_34510, partial [Polyangiales bacterium]